MIRDTENTLREHGIRPTAVRTLIYRTASAHHNTFSLQDMETELDTVDKSTIFRTLTLFADRHLLHEIEDGSGKKKYCVCHNDHTCTPGEMHVHFYCEECHTTFCLDHTLIPAVTLPAGFEARQAEYLVKGICSSCSRR